MKADSRREILTVEQAADLLQVSTKFIYHSIRDGTLQAVRLGKFWRITRAEVLRTCSKRNVRRNRKVKKEARELETATAS